MPPDDIHPAGVPRVRLAQLPTPLEPMDRFSEWLGGPRVLVKRDDLTGRARVLGVDVGTRPDLDDVIPRLAVEAAARAGRAAPGNELVLDHSRFGDGYGAVTESALEAIDRVAGLEGVILDPVYTGKAMAGLIGAARDGHFGTGDTVVFWHTGGAVALFAHRYAELFSRR